MEALAARKLGKSDWETWLKRRVELLADVQELIKALELPRDLGEELDSSVRDEYYRLWDAAQNGWDPSAG